MITRFVPVICCLVFNLFVPTGLLGQCAGCASGKGCKKSLGVAACPIQKEPIAAYKPKEISSASLSGNPSQFPPPVASPPAGFPQELGSQKEYFGGSEATYGGSDMTNADLEPGKIYQMQLSRGQASHIDVNMDLPDGMSLKYRQTQGSFTTPTWGSWQLSEEGNISFGALRTTSTDPASPWYKSKSSLDYVQFQVIELFHPGRDEPGAGQGIDVHPPELGYHITESGTPPQETATARLLHPSITFDAGIGANSSRLFCGKLVFNLALDTPFPTRSNVKLVDYRSNPGATAWSSDITVTPPALGSTISTVVTATARAELTDVIAGGNTVGFRIQFFSPPTSTTVAHEWVVQQSTEDSLPGVWVRELRNSVLLSSRSVHYAGTVDDGNVVSYDYLDIDHLNEIYSKDTVEMSWGADLGSPSSIHRRVVQTDSGFISNNVKVLERVEVVEYQLMPWGKEEVVQRTSDPNGAALTTTYSYYDQYPAGPMPSPYDPTKEADYQYYMAMRRYGKLKGMVHPDGKWELHTHLEGWRLGPYGQFRPSRYSSTEAIETPFGDGEASFDPHTQNSPSSLLSERRLVSREQYKNDSSSDSGLFNGFSVHFEEASRNVKTTASRWGAHSSGADFGFRHLSTQLDLIDSSLDVPSNEISLNEKKTWQQRRGTITFNSSTNEFQFTNSNVGKCRETMELVRDEAVISQSRKFFKKTVTLTDEHQREVSKETWRPDGRTPQNQTDALAMTWISAGKESTVYDSRDRVTQRYVNGRLEYSASYPDDLTTIETDAAGVTSTTTRLGGGRIASVTRAAMTASGALPAIPVMTTSYTYTNGRFDPSDASPVFAAVGTNHTVLKVTKTVESAGVSSSSYEIFDLAGRMVCSCDEQGRIYLYLVENISGSGRRETRIGPGGVREVKEHFLDGRLKRTYTQQGPDIVSERSYAYKYVYKDANGAWLDVSTVDTSTTAGKTLTQTAFACLQTKEFQGPTALGRWRSSIVDGAGVTLKTAESTPAGEKSQEWSGHATAVVGTYGQPTKVSRTGFPAHQYVYNFFGDAIRQGSELNGDASTNANFLSGALASPDRVTLTARWWESDSSGTWAVEEESKGFLPDLAGSVTGTEVKNLRKSLLKPAAANVLSDTILQQADGKSLRRTVTYDAASKTTTETTSSNQAGVGQTGVSLSRMGRVYQRRELHGDTASTVTYAYHPMGELMSMTTSTGLELLYQEYNPSGQLSLKRSPADGQTTYSYYPADHVSAGLLEDETNAQGNTRSYTYDSIGRVLTLRGTAAQPLDYAYNSLGEMERLTTYRTDDPATAAHTDWYYDPVSGALRAKVPDAPATRLIPDYTEEFCLSSSPPGTVQYAYDSDGRLLKKLNARGQVIAYTHAPNTGDLTNVDYEAASATADVTFTNHDRLGRARTITDGSGTRILLYQADSKNPAEVNYTAGALAGLKYSAPLGTTGLPSGVELHRGLTKDYDADYSYDTQGRLERVTLAGLASASYNYDPVTNRVRDLRHYDLNAGDDPVGQPEGYNIAHTSIPIPGAMQSSTSSVGKPATGGNVPLSGVAYQHDDLGRRTKATQADGSWHEYGYNERGEVNAAKRLWPAPPGTPPSVPGSPATLGGTIYQYGYDKIGNRRTEIRRSISSSGGYTAVIPTWSATYNQQNQHELAASTSNILLQGETSEPSDVRLSYTIADTPGTSFEGTVSRSGKLFYAWVYVPGRIVTYTPTITFYFMQSNGVESSFTMTGRPRTISFPRWVQFTLTQGSQVQSGDIYVPPHRASNLVTSGGILWGTSSQTFQIVEGYPMLNGATDSFYYDEDGNLTHTSRWNYSWDDENRLLYMQTTPTAAEAGVPAVRVSFTYDYMGRRVSKSVQSVTYGTGYNSVLNGPPYTLGTAVVERYVYDKWNLIMTYNDNGGTLTPSHSYVWGLDLAGQHGGGMARSQAAGGVGGLLFDCFGPTTSTSTACYIPSADGNGNILSYALLGDPSAPAASYTYEPFGKVESQTINLPAVASQFRFGFSSKFTDSETGMVYYGHRYYSPELGRFLSRDPIAERGGINLYGFVGNDPVNRVDRLGLADWQLKVLGKSTDSAVNSEAAHGDLLRIMGALTKRRVSSSDWKPQNGPIASVPSSMLAGGDNTYPYIEVFLVTKSQRNWSSRQNPALQFSGSGTTGEPHLVQKAIIRVDSATGKIRLQQLDSTWSVMQEAPAGQAPGRGAPGGALSSQLKPVLTANSASVADGKITLTYSGSGGWDRAGFVDNFNDGVVPPGSDPLSQFRWTDPSQWNDDPSSMFDDDIDDNHGNKDGSTTISITLSVESVCVKK